MNNWSASKKFIVGGMILSVLSLFFTWSKLAFISANGFQQQAYILLIVFIYPLICIVKENPIHKIGGYICGGVGIFFGILFLSDSSTNFFGATVNTAGTGAYVFILSCILFLIGVYKQEEQKTKEQNEKES